MSTIVNGVGANKTNTNNEESPRKRARMLVEYSSKATVVLGAQWGDEGKGKVVDMLAADADVVCRCQVIFVLMTIILLRQKKKKLDSKC